MVFFFGRMPIRDGRVEVSANLRLMASIGAVNKFRSRLTYIGPFGHVTSLARNNEACSEGPLFYL